MQLGQRQPVNDGYHSDVKNITAQQYRLFWFG